MAWLWYAFVWERAEVFSMWWADKCRGLQERKVRVLACQRPQVGCFWPSGGRSPMLPLHHSLSYMVTKVPLHQVLTDLLGTRLNSHHRSWVEWRAPARADTSENTVSTFHSQMSAAAYNGTSVLVTFYAETPVDCGLAKCPWYTGDERDMVYRMVVLRAVDMLGMNYIFWWDIWICSNFFRQWKLEREIVCDLWRLAISPRPSSVSCQPLI